MSDAGIPSSDAAAAAAPPAATAGVARSAGLVGIATMASRILGLLRDQVFLWTFGAGHAMDAYNVAFRLPNLNGEVISSGQLKGRPMVLVVGTSKLAAEDCREWMLTLHDNFKDSRAAVFQVIVLNKAWYIPDFMVIKELKDFVPSHGHELVLLEWKTRFGDVFKIPYDHSPRVIVVDQSGRIRKWYQGEMNDDALVEVINLVTDLNGKG